MMRKLRKLADRTGWTVEDLIHEGVVEFVAKCEDLHMPEHWRISADASKSRQ